MLVIRHLCSIFIFRRRCALSMQLKDDPSSGSDCDTPLEKRNTRKQFPKKPKLTAAEQGDVASKRKLGRPRKNPRTDNVPKGKRRGRSKKSQVPSTGKGGGTRAKRKNATNATENGANSNKKLKPNESPRESSVSSRGSSSACSKQRSDSSLGFKIGTNSEFRTIVSSTDIVSSPRGSHNVQSDSKEREIPKIPQGDLQDEGNQDDDDDDIQFLAFSFDERRRSMRTSKSLYRGSPSKKKRRRSSPSTASASTSSPRVSRDTSSGKSSVPESSWASVSSPVSSRMHESSSPSPSRRISSSKKPRLSESSSFSSPEGDVSLPEGAPSNVHEVSSPAPSPTTSNASSSPRDTSSRESKVPESSSSAPTKQKRKIVSHSALSSGNAKSKATSASGKVRRRKIAAVATHIAKDKKGGPKRRKISAVGPSSKLRKSFPSSSSVSQQLQNSAGARSSSRSKPKPPRARRALPGGKANKSRLKSALFSRSRGAGSPRRSVSSPRARARGASQDASRTKQSISSPSHSTAAAPVSTQKQPDATPGSLVADNGHESSSPTGSAQKSKLHLPAAMPRLLVLEKSEMETHDVTSSSRKSSSVPPQSSAPTSEPCRKPSSSSSEVKYGDVVKSDADDKKAVGSGRDGVEHVPLQLPESDSENNSRTTAQVSDSPPTERVIAEGESNVVAARATLSSETRDKELPATSRPSEADSQSDSHKITGDSDSDRPHTGTASINGAAIPVPGKVARTDVAKAIVALDAQARAALVRFFALVRVIQFGSFCFNAYAQ